MTPQDEDQERTFISPRQSTRESGPRQKKERFRSQSRDRYDPDIIITSCHATHDGDEESKKTSGSDTK